MAKKITKKPLVDKKQIKSISVSPLKVLQIIAYVLLWLVIWSSVAFVMAGLLLVFVIAAFYGQEITPAEANSSILVTSFLVAGIFFGVFWLLRKRKSLFMKVSRLTLITCTAIGLVGMIVTTVAGHWVPHDASESTPVQQKEITEVKEKKEVRRRQYMLCSNGTYRYFTDEQFKDPNVGFTEESEDSCAFSGNGKKAKLADSPPAAPTQQPGYNKAYADMLEKQKKDQECSDLLYRRFTQPRDSLKVTMGGVPSTAHIIHYIGTSQYESVVAEHNRRARQWNSSIESYRQDYRNSAIIMGCPTNPIGLDYAFDKAYEYNSF